jgi:hypothetical protein
MSLEPGIIDTNVLVYGVASEAPQHRASRALLDAAREDVGPLRILLSGHESAPSCGAFEC